METATCRCGKQWNRDELEAGIAWLTLFESDVDNPYNWRDVRSCPACKGH